MGVCDGVCAFRPANAAAFRQTHRLLVALVFSLPTARARHPRLPQRALQCFEFRGIDIRNEVGKRMLLTNE